MQKMRHVTVCLRPIAVIRVHVGARHVVAGGAAKARGTAYGASLWRSGAERADCLAVRGLAPASPNSLRSLRSLRSDSGDGHDHERASRWAQALCSSAPQRRAARCPHGPSPPSFWFARVGAQDTEYQRPSVAAGGTRRGRFVGRRGAQRQGRRAQRASSTFSSHLSERSARRARSELCDAPLPRAPQGSLRVQRQTAPP